MTGWERARFSTVARGSNLVAASWRTEKSSVPTSSLSHAAKNDSSPKRLSEIRERSLWTWGTALATQNGPRSPGTRARTQAGQGITQGVPPPTQSATLFRLPSFHSLSPFRLFTTRFRLHHNLRHSFRIHLIALATPPAKPFHDPSHSPSHQTTSRY